MLFKSKLGMPKRILHHFPKNPYIFLFLITCLNIFMFYKPLNFTHQDLIICNLQKHFQPLLEITNGNWAEIVSQDKLMEISSELFLELKNLNCHFDMARVFVTMPLTKIPVHTDGSEEWPKHTAINFPIFNTKNSLMRWYSILQNKSYKINDPRYGNGPRIYHNDDVQFVDSLELTTPHLVRIDGPHDVINNNPHNRVILSIRCRPEPLHLW